jgi:D-sedoheptulose 7-phosphate isomerase
MRTNTWSNWNEYLDKLRGLLEDLAFTDTNGMTMEQRDGFASWLGLAAPAIHDGRSIFFIGNGASASMASHFSADLGKNGSLRTYTFTDLSLITALANDTSYENVFMDPIKRYMEPSDLLIAISSSGNSPNIVNAVRAARELGGSVVTLSGMNRDNAIRSMGHLNAYAAAPTYDLVESAHAVVLHYWVNMCLEKIKTSASADNA